MRRSMIATLLALGAVLVFAFQNCAQDVQFNSAAKFASTEGLSVETPPEDPVTEIPPIDVPPENVICDPLNPQESQGCDVQTQDGLAGNLYYLTDQYIQNNRDDLSFINTQTFVNEGLHPNVLVLFNSINVTPRSWTEGFANANGQLLVNNNGNVLVEWFSVHLDGFISLPAGNYQFATVSDDGIVVNMDGEDVVVNDTQHAPKWDCSQKVVTFEANEVKDLKVKYWQGPRTQIAMQLLVRPASEKNHSCDEGGGWIVVPPEAFSH